MFGFLKKNEDKLEEDLYYKNIKEASLFLDKSLLALSSIFLGFLFSQLQDFLKLDLINVGYLIVSIISIGLTIILVLFSYIVTIFQSNLGYNIQKGYIDYDKGICRFNFYDSLQNILRVLYFITFICPIVYIILFYVTNLNRYVG